MTNADGATLLALAERVEKGAANEQRALLREAILLVQVDEPIELVQLRLEWIETGAFESAAMSLVPEGWDFTLDRVNGFGAAQIFSDRKLEAEGAGIGATPALALTAACLRSRAAQGSEQ